MSWNAVELVGRFDVSEAYGEALWEVSLVSTDGVIAGSVSTLIMSSDTNTWYTIGVLNKVPDHSLGGSVSTALDSLDRCLTPAVFGSVWVRDLVLADLTVEVTCDPTGCLDEICVTGECGCSWTSDVRNHDIVPVFASVDSGSDRRWLVSACGRRLLLCTLLSIRCCGLV